MRFLVEMYRPRMGNVLYYVYQKHPALGVKRLQKNKTQGDLWKGMN